VIGSWINLMGYLLLETLRKQVIEQIEAYDALTHSSEKVSLADAQDMASELHKAADNMSGFAMWYRLLITYMNLLFMARCFLILEFQPRLAIVIKTLKATTVDLLHFLIVFVPTFLAYAIAGMCIFGRRMDEFSSVERSIGTCFKIAFESEFQWEKLSEEDFVTSLMWVWSFLLLIVLLMLNMVLAIIMDVYVEVRNAAGNSETVFQNIKSVGKRIWLWNSWVSNDKLITVLNDMPRTMTGREFRNAFPTMTDFQYKKLMEAAESKQRMGMRADMHNTFLAHMTSAIKLGIDRAASGISRIKKDMESLSEKGDTRSQEFCVEDIRQSMAVQNHWLTSVQGQLESLRNDTQRMTGRTQTQGENTRFSTKDFEVSAE